MVIYAAGGEYLNAYAASFSLSSSGEELFLFDADGNLCDKFTVPALAADTSYGRNSDGATLCAVMGTPTPKTANKDVRSYDDSYLTFSHASGFYPETFSLTMGAPDGFAVYYTTDCTDPLTSETAVRYAGEDIRVEDPSSSPDVFSKINVTGSTGMFVPSEPVEKCFVVRAAAVNVDGIATRTQTKVYFIGYDDRPDFQDIAVLTLTTDPANLYDKDIGLFVNWDENGKPQKWSNDTHNGPEWERQVNFTLFRADGSLWFDQEVGIRIRGTSTRGAQQKSLNVYARSRYDGNGAFKDPMYEGVSQTESVYLRADGVVTPTLGTAFLQTLVSDRDFATSAWFPVMVFIEGEYAGMYQMYERFSEDYAQAHYHVSDDNVYIVKKGGSNSAAEENVEGGKDAYRVFYNYACNTDLSIPENYEKLCEMVDMQSLIDIMCAQMYYGNEDFSMAQNISAWRVIDPELEDADNPYADGRWRFVMYDLDFCIGMYNSTKYNVTTDTFTVMQPFAGAGFVEWPIVKSLMKSDTFRQDFGATFCDLANVNFDYEDAVRDVVAETQDLYGPHMNAYFRRYNPKSSSGAIRDEAHFRARSAKFGTYFLERPEYILPFMSSAIRLSGTFATLTLHSDAGTGSILLNTVTPPMEEGGEWEGVYDISLVLTVTAVAPEGYTFAGWETNGVTLTEGEETSSVISFTMGESGASVRALFTPVSE